MKIHHENKDASSISHVVEHRSFSSKLHWHDNFELCEIIEDKACEFLVDGEIIVARKGDFIALPEKTLHWFGNIEDGTCIRIIQFSTKIVFGLINYTSTLKRHIKAEEIEKISGLREKLNMLCSMADNEHQGTGNERNLVLEHLISSIFLLLLRYFPSEYEVDVAKRQRHTIYEIVKYININFKNDINTKQIAADFLRSRGRLANEFEKYAGVSMKQYIDELRLKNAISLLTEGATVSEAAFESGFQSIRTFNSIFKKYMKITPTEFKENKRPD